MDPGSSSVLDEKNSALAIEMLLKQLNVTRRMISLYPSDHPQIRTSEIAEIISHKLSGTPIEQEQAAAGIGQLLSFGHSRRQSPASFGNYDQTSSGY